MNITFDIDTYRSNDFAGFLRVLLGPIEIADSTGLEPWDRCRGCNHLSVDFSFSPDGYIDACSACVNDALRLRGLAMSYCPDCRGMQGVMPILPGHKPETFNHSHVTPFIWDEVPS